MTRARPGAFIMRKSLFVVAGIATISLGMSGCSVDSKTGSRTGTGAAVGAAAGATVGLLSGNFLASTLTGAAAGAAGGFVYDQVKK
jgi:osmotically inducible lipoprotein OsmB